MRLRLGEREFEAFATPRSRSLFAFLLTCGRVVGRDALANELWSDLPDARARKALNTELWRMRTALARAGVRLEEYLYSGSDGVGFRSDSPHWVDTAELETAVQVALLREPWDAGEQELGRLEAAIALYRGDLLEGVHDEWCLVQREALRAKLQAALEYLLRVRMAASDWQAALMWGRRLLELDPLMEHAHRAVMRCHQALGNRPAALRQFERCAALLREELDVAPMVETRRLMLEIRSASATVAPEHAGQRSTPSSDLDRAIDKLDAARRLLVNVRGRAQALPPPSGSL